LFKHISLGGLGHRLNIDSLSLPIALVYPWRATLHNPTTRPPDAARNQARRRYQVDVLCPELPVAHYAAALNYCLSRKSQLCPMTEYTSSQPIPAQSQHGRALCRVAWHRYSRLRISSTKDPEEIEDWFG
jgi:hypothetical protein